MRKNANEKGVISMEELISVIIPVYNAELYVENMVQMIKEQTYTNLEIIIINDGSKDETEKELYRHINEDNRFHVYTKENSGPSGTRNFGINQAKGKYVAFIDADDYIYPVYISYLYELIKRYEADMACCEYCKVLRKENNIRIKDSLEESVFGKENALENLYRKRYLTGYPYLKLIKKDKIGDVRFPENISYAEDIIFVDEIIRKSNRIVYGGRVLYLYYQNRNSITHQIDSNKLRDSWNFHKEYYERRLEKETEAVKKAIESKQFIMSMDICCRVWSLDKSFRNELLIYIKKMGRYIFRNKENRKMHRILAAMSCVNVKYTIKVCLFYQWLQIKLKMQNRKAL